METTEVPTVKTLLLYEQGDTISALYLWPHGCERCSAHIEAELGKGFVSFRFIWGGNKRKKGTWPNKDIVPAISTKKRMEMNIEIMELPIYKGER